MQDKHATYRQTCCKRSYHLTNEAMRHPCEGLRLSHRSYSLNQVDGTADIILPQIKSVPGHVVGWDVAGRAWRREQLAWYAGRGLTSRMQMISRWMCAAIMQPWPAVEMRRRQVDRIVIGDRRGSGENHLMRPNGGCMGRRIAHAHCGLMQTSPEITGENV